MRSCLWRDTKAYANYRHLPLFNYVGFLRILEGSQREEDKAAGSWCAFLSEDCL
jgi:hypothetical protein